MTGLLLADSPGPASRSRAGRHISLGRLWRRRFFGRVQSFRYGRLAVRENFVGGEHVEGVAQSLGPELPLGFVEDLRLPRGLKFSLPKY